MEEIAEPETETKDLCKITTLFQNNFSIDFTISKTQKVSDLKSMIENSQSVILPEGKHIQLLYLGHFLNDDSTIKDIENKLRTFTIHVIFKSDQKDEEFSEENELRGFDRLATMNYTQSQIEQIRRQFHQMANSNQLTPEQQIEEEEEWFPALFNRSDTAINLFGPQRREDEIPLVFDHSPSYSTNLNLLVGFFIGLVFGLAAIIFVPIIYNEKKLFLGIGLGAFFKYGANQMLQF